MIRTYVYSYHMQHLIVALYIMWYCISLTVISQCNHHRDMCFYSDYMALYLLLIQSFVYSLEC